MPVEFINQDAETILSDIISLYEDKSGLTLNDADPERIIIDCMSYREVLLRVAIQYLMQQNFVQLAEGDRLDYWGELFAVIRIDGEDDDSYRERILAATSSEGLGTKAAYKSRILSLANVADVLIFSKNDDNSLAPGHVRLIPIEKVGDPASGEVHGPSLENEILEAILVDDFGIIGNVFQFEPAIARPINGTVTVTKESGYDEAAIIANIDYQLSRYFGQLSLAFGSEFGLADLQNYLLNAPGLNQIVNLNFDTVPALEVGQFYQRGIVNINIE